MMTELEMFRLHKQRNLVESIPETIFETDSNAEMGSVFSSMVGIDGLKSSNRLSGVRSQQRGRQRGISSSWLDMEEVVEKEISEEEKDESWFVQE
jgi:hypothetical protein